MHLAMAVAERRGVSMPSRAFSGLAPETEILGAHSTKIGQLSGPFENSHAPNKRQGPMGRDQVEGRARN